MAPVDGMQIFAGLVVLLVGLGLGGLIGVLWARARSGEQAAEPALLALERNSDERAVVREGLERLGDQLRDLAHDRASWQGQFAQQVADMRVTTESLRRETAGLATALRRPAVRGRWGELHLRRVVELAGMVAHCDFVEQASLDDGALRPDLVVRLAGGRSIVVDAKTPLDAFIDATSVDDAEARDHHLRRHAEQVRRHVDQLGTKRYWRALPDSPELVVLFVPSEGVLATALDQAPDLLEHAAARRVVLASPTTLIALLRTIAHGWTQAALTDRAAEIHRLGRDLHERLGTMGGHLDQLGRSLQSAVGHFNGAVGSWESRVLVSARRFHELGVGDDEQLAPPRQLHVAVRRGADTTEQEPPTVAL